MKKKICHLVASLLFASVTYFLDNCSKEGIIFYYLTLVKCSYIEINPLKEHAKIKTSVFRKHILLGHTCTFSAGTPDMLEREVHRSEMEPTFGTVSLYCSRGTIAMAASTFLSWGTAAFRLFCFTCVGLARGSSLTR